MKKSFIKRNSITTKTIGILLLIVAIQSGIFFFVLMQSGIFESVEETSFEAFNEKVTSRRNYIEDEMLSHYMNINSYANRIEDKITTYLETYQYEMSEVASTPQYAAPLITEISDDLIQILRNNQVSGTYILLANETSELSYKTNGLYLRDPDPLSNPNDISDLQCIRGLPSVSENLNIPLSTDWLPQYEISEENENDDFIYKMKEMITKNPEYSDLELSYWNTTYQLDNSVDKLISYTYPIRDENNKLLAFIGIDLTEDFLKTVIPNRELGQDTAYVLVYEHAGDLYQLAHNGSQFTRNFSNAEIIASEGETKYNEIYQFKDKFNHNFYGSLKPIKLYEHTSPYQQDEWYILGMINEDEIFSTRLGLFKSNVFATLISLCSALVFVLIITKIYTKPIEELAENVKNMNPNFPVKLKPSKIDELDELKYAIENLSHNVAESASSFARILSLTSYPFCAFEYYESHEKYFCSEQLIELLALPNQPIKEVNGKESLKNLLFALEDYLESEKEEGQLRIFYLPKDINNHQRWLRMHVIEENQHVYGVIENITSEMYELKKIEYERDYDSLTHLLNRRAYNRAMLTLFDHPNDLKVGALMMIDLDNLKYINDTYGHDYGDDYIRLMGNTLTNTLPESTIISRISGDEFMVFFSGYLNKVEIVKIIELFSNEMNERYLKLPDGTRSRLRATAGVAWFPDDSTDFNSLGKYADFAMYKMKNTNKGGINYFKMMEYNNDAYLLQAKEDLNTLIEQQAIHYCYQPIVDARTGEIYGYEALMRSEMPSLSSPLDILRIAKSQSKLYHIEHMTMFKALEGYINQDINQSYKLFVNSISNQSLNDADLKRFEDKFKYHLHQIVIEVTEEEKLDLNSVNRKRRALLRWGAEVAIDDYGTGYNGESVLLEMAPNYIKVDQSIVRNLEKDINRYRLLTNIISYAQSNNIKVIAEGVETMEELKILIKVGIDYVQGYYLAYPQRTLSDIAEEKRELIKKFALEKLSDEEY